jgi:hypothetical protein
VKSLITHSQTPLNLLLIEDDDGEARALERAVHKAGIGNPIIRAVDGGGGSFTDALGTTAVSLNNGTAVPLVAGTATLLVTSDRHRLA